MKTVLITGGSGGIGEALVNIYAKNGYKVVSVDIVAAPSPVDGVSYHIADVASPEAMRAVAQNYDKIDILINNAAVQYIAPIFEQTNEEIKRVLDVNVFGVINTVRAFKGKLGGGIVVNIGSIHSSVPRVNKIPYDMSKAALSVFTKELALELSGDGTRSICVEFGAVKTPMNGNFEDETEKNAALEKQVTRHMTSADECAEVVFALTKEPFSIANGSSFVVDCGRSLT